MKRLVVSAAARADLRNIARYSRREWGKSRARQYLELIRARFANLRHWPEQGPLRTDIGLPYRAVLAGRHVVFYTVEGDAILIVRGLHQRMDVVLH